MKCTADDLDEVVLLHNARGTDFVEVTDHLDYQNRNRTYVDGAIELRINDSMILDRSMWDLIDILWIYIVDMLDDLKDSDHAQLQFPDQPLTLSCERIGRRMLQVSSHLAQLRRSAVVSEWNFVAEVKAAGLLFFCVADRLQGGYTDPIRRPERYQPKY